MLPGMGNRCCVSIKRTDKRRVGQVSCKASGRLHADGQHAIGKYAVGSMPGKAFFELNAPQLKNSPNPAV